MRIDQYSQATTSVSGDRLPILINPATDPALKTIEICLLARLLSAMSYCVDSGVANAITIAVPGSPTSWTDLVGIKLLVKIKATNTDVVTIAVTGITETKSVKKNVSDALAASDLLIGGIYEFVYDGTNVQKM